jgi:hypothetical protein
MRKHSLGICFALTTVFICSPRIAAQSKKTPRPAKAAPSGEIPDLSGVWMQDQPPATAMQYWVYELRVEEPPMTAWGEAQLKAAKSSFGAHPYPLAETNDPVYKGCFPPGVPRIYTHPFPMQILQTSDQIVMLFEYDSMRRYIYTDGRAHETSLGPSWMGDSIGHWERDTLVIDTINLNDKTWLDRVGHPHSEALHLTERLRRMNHDHLIDDITIEDPKAYTKPWTAHLDFLLRPKWRLEEQFCEDGETFQNLENKETTPVK